MFKVYDNFNFSDIYIFDEIVGRRHRRCPRKLMCPSCSGLKLMRNSVLVLECSELQPQSVTVHELPTPRGDT